MSTIVTFGEIMGRVTPHNHERFRQAIPGSVKMIFAGAEANVAVSIAMLGAPSLFVTALPDNEIGKACLSTLQGLGVNTEYILSKTSGRMGLFFTETGANQRPSRVIYDREHSTFSITGYQEYNWSSILKDARWLHITGISPALSSIVADAAIKITGQAKNMGLTVSCDLNYRNNLWKWDAGKTSRQLAESIMVQILTNVDVLFANEEDASDVLSVHPENTDVHQGQFDYEKYSDVAKRIISKFQNISIVATTFRESISANHNNWGAMLYDAKTGNSYYAPEHNGKYAPYMITDIVDRVGGGDAFAAGLIFALTTPDLYTLKSALSFAVASSCLAHSIPGDFNYSTCNEVGALMAGNCRGRIVR